MDFNSSPINVTFNRRTTRAFTFVPIIDDNFNELIENFSISIEIPQQFSNIGVILGDPANATGFIIDNDGMIVASICCMYDEIFDALLMLKTILPGLL